MPKRALRLFCVFLFLCLSSAVHAAHTAPTRLALIVANGEYANLPDLENPLIDAKSIKSRLDATGYTTEMALDLPAAELSRKLTKIAHQVRAMPPSSIFLFYYAGHGFEVGGQNYIAPTDARLVETTAENVEALTAIVSLLAPPEGTSTFFFLDSCRLISANGNYRGFAREEPLADTLIAFSTALAAPAADGVAGAGSPFAIAFADALLERGVTGPDLMALVQNRMPNLAPEQTPVFFSNLTRTTPLNQASNTARERRTALAFKANREGLRSEALQFARTSAQEGDLDAMAFLTAQGLPEESVHWARKAEAAGTDYGRRIFSVFIARRLARMDKSQRLKAIARPEAKRALSILEREASLGNIAALRELGGLELMKALSYSDQRNSTKVLKYFDAALEAGDVASAHELSFIYIAGVGVAKDRIKAAHYSEILYRSGRTNGTQYAVIASTIGLHARDPQRDAEPFQILKRNAEGGDILAFLPLAAFYYVGIGTPPDRPNASKWAAAFEQSKNSSRFRFPEEQYSLGRSIRDGTYQESEM